MRKVYWHENAAFIPIWVRSGKKQVFSGSFGWGRKESGWFLWKITENNARFLTKRIEGQNITILALYADGGLSCIVVLQNAAGCPSALPLRFLSLGPDEVTE